jgi:protein SCO1/2
MRYPLAIFLVISVILFTNDASAQLNQGGPAVLKEIGVDEKLGDSIPLDLVFTNSDGEQVTLRELFEGDKPVLLNPLYYDCPVLCGVVLDGVFRAVKQLAWSPGSDYTIISFSIDPDEGSDLASSSKEFYLNQFDRQGAADGWHFLTGSQESIQKLTEAIGFRYKYEEETGEYIHLASIMMLSPDGKITRYLYGANFKEFDVRNALFEAADGTIGNSLDKVIMYCFTYDPSSQSYVPVAMNIMKLGGLATLIILGIFLSVFWRRERNKKDSTPTTKFEFDR